MKKTFLLLLFALGISVWGWGQQVIGSFPSMDGGFENQTGTLATASSISSAQTEWTTQIASAGEISNTGGRSGPKFVTYTQSGTTHRRLQSPTANITAASHVVQFYYQGDMDGTIGGDIRGAVSAVGTTSPAYGSYITDPNTGETWTKYTAVVTTTGTPAHGIGIVSTNQTGIFKIDDFVVYPGSAADETAPNQPGEVTIGNPTQTSLDVSWGAASGGVDGGGYLVVRFASDPGTGNDPNQNGIYAVGNTIPTGGTVRYIGTGLSFTDDVGLTLGTQYWYKVYTVDKAFNYSSESTGTGSTSGGSTPLISVTPSTLSDFTYVEGSGPSASKNFDISGENLTHNINIAASTNYEISLDDSDFSESPIILTQSGGSVSSTTIHVRLKAGLSAGSYNSEEITASSAGADDKIVSCSGSVTEALATEPTSHATDFGATANSSSAITVTWTDSDASSYLIKGSAVSYAAIVDPVDGTAENDGGLVINVVSTVQTHQFIGLNPSTPYYFKIFPYNGTGATINYKTDGSVPQATATTESAPAVTYTWIGANDASWAVSTNWSPERTTPLTTDILQFNDGSTKTVTGVVNQTIGKFIVTNGTKISLQSTGGATLTIAGGDNTDLIVESNCELNYTSTIANFVAINISSGATGLISGYMYLNGAAHRLTAADASSLQFASGSVFDFRGSGNAFGTGTANSVIFQSGSTYISQSGGNPFGLSVPNSVVVFQTGSLYSHRQTGSPSLSGRTYADFEVNLSTINFTNLTGTGVLTLDNLTVTDGLMNLNLTGGIFINGSISVADGETLGFSPASASNLTLGATGQQEISGGGTLVFGANCNVIVDAGSETVIKRNVSIGGNLSVNSGGSFVIDPSRQLTVTGTLTNNGSLTIKSDASGTGSLIHSTANVAAKVERYIAAANWGTEDDGWHQISSPVASQVIYPEFVSGYALGNEDFYKWDETTNLWINIKNSGGTAWNPAFETNFVPGTGYFVSYENTDTKEFTGNLNVSDVTVGALTLSSGENSGWHLLGNPFTSALTWYTDWSLTNIGGVANIWNRTAKSYSPVNAGEPIPAMNGFLVKVTAAPGSVTIPAAKRTHSAQAWYKNSDYPVIRLLAHNLDYPSYQESQVRFNPMSSEGFDNEFDGRFLPGYAPRFYSMVDGKKCMVNSMPSLSAETEIPFDFILNKGSNFSIEANGLDNFPATAYLNDIKTGTVHNLSQNPVYTFTAAEGDAPNRFKLTFGSVGIETPAGKPIAAYYAAGRLHFVNAQAEKTIEVFNLAGQRIIFAKTTADEYPVNLSAGMYVVKVSTAQQLVSAKFFVK